jgi:DNA polymerase-3 subunit epsilon
VNDSLLEGPVAFVDVETTGGHTARHRVIEIGLVAAKDGELEYEWSTLVNPGFPIPAGIQHFTGITDEMVRCAPFFEDVAQELERRLDGRLFVAHNARFDYGFLRSELARTGRKLTNRMACTVRLSRRLYPEMERHNLDAVIAHHGLSIEARHRALPDAQALWQFWCVLANRSQREEVEDALREISYLKSLPPHLPSTLADDLPEAPGVYRFFGEADALLYVGKARNIRTRVLAHWQSSSRDAREQRLGEATRRVDWIETAGELGALLEEARLVRELKPLHNRALRGCRQVFTWVVADDGAAPELAPMDLLPLTFEHSDAFGLYRSEAAARRALRLVAKEHQLCLKALDLEDSGGSCFAYQLGRCAGACVGKEDLRLHTMRLKMALANERVRTWPFRGPVGIRERSARGIEQLHILDSWRHVATIEEADAMPSRRRLMPFDADVYKILSRYLNGRARIRVIDLSALDADADAA